MYIIVQKLQHHFILFVPVLLIGSIQKTLQEIDAKMTTLWKYLEIQKLVQVQQNNCSSWS